MKKVIKLCLAFVLIIATTFSLSSCIIIEALFGATLFNRDSEYFIYNFSKCGEDEAYVCKINDEVEFWCSSSHECGEFIVGETKIPLLITVFESRYKNEMVLWFYDSFGGKSASLSLIFSSRLFNEQSVTIVEQVELVVEDESKREWYEELLRNIPFEGAKVEKVKKYFSPNTSSIFKDIDELMQLAIETNAVITSPEKNFWFDVFTGYGEMRTKNGTTKTITAEFQTRSPDSENYERKIRINVLANGETVYGELQCDENGVFFWDYQDDERSKIHLQLATEDPRQPYFNFMSFSDEVGNCFKFICEEGNFEFSGEEGVGEWQNAIGKRDIQCTIGELPYSLYFYFIDDEEKPVVLKAEYIETVDENTARFRIYDDFLMNEIFPDRAQTEFIITKQMIPNN